MISEIEVLLANLHRSLATAVLVERYAKRADATELLSFVRRVVSMAEVYAVRVQ